MQIVKGMVAYGAAAMAEIDRITRRLKARAGEADLDKVWREEWSKEADRVAEIGDEAAADGRTITAGNHYMRAGNYYYSAERFIPPGEEKLAMYRKALRCYQGAMERLHPDIERVEVPYENTSLPAWFVKGRGLGKRPTVVLFDGMDNAKEMSVIFAGLDFAKRGINTLAIDGPGQSEPLRLRNIHEPSRLRGRRHSGLRLCRLAARGRSQARGGDGLQLRRLSCAAHLRLRQALRRLRRVRRDALEHLRLGGRQQGRRRDRSAAQLDLDLPVPLGGRRARQRDRARMGEEIHARGRGRERRMPVPDPARRERPHRAGRCGQEAL